MFFRPQSKHFFAIVLLILSMMVLGSCTRERSPWLGGTPDPLIKNLTLTSTPVPPSPANDSERLSQATLEPGEALINTTPISERGLPPLPGNETLTPKPSTPTVEPKFTLYKIEPGDSLYTIAIQFGITVEDIKRHNQLNNPNNLRTGQELKIPQTSPTATDEQGSQNDEGYIHVVKPGETLFGIARQYSVPLNELAKANNITNPGALRVGRRLRIPNASAPQSSNTGSRVHIVQPGETLSEIAIKYGVTPNDIVEINSLSNPSRIVSGQKLIIP